VIGLQNGSELAVFHDLDTLDIPNENLIKNYKVGEKLTRITQHKLEPLYQLDTTMLLVVDSLGIYNKLSFNPAAVLLRSSPKINLERMIDSLQPIYIIADASNYTTYVNRWKTTCRRKAVNFHYTKDEGAFVLD
jgi:competence protein ComEC